MTTPSAIDVHTHIDAGEFFFSRSLCSARATSNVRWPAGSGAVGHCCRHLKHVHDPPLVLPDGLTDRSVEHRSAPRCRWCVSAVASSRRCLRNGPVCRCPRNLLWVLMASVIRRRMSLTARSDTFNDQRDANMVCVVLTDGDRRLFAPRTVRPCQGIPRVGPRKSEGNEF